MRVLLLDNVDSFVWNLAQGLGRLGAAVTVRRSSEATWPELESAQLIVLSPGPGRPEGAGICIDAVRRLSGTVPILGVCLGHQAIAAAFGARVERCAPQHGIASPVEIVLPHPLLAHLPSPFSAGRYHSLGVPEPSLPPELQVLARSDDDIVMAIAHRTHPTWGVQFHPESFLTEFGQRILQNAMEAAA